MYSKIVVGYDGSPGAEDALALASQLSQATGAPLLLTYVQIAEAKWSRTQRDYQRSLRAKVARILGPALDSLPEGISATKASLESRSPARGLYELAAEEHASLLVLGSTHRGPVGRVVIGSVGELVCTCAPCAVTVAPKGYAARAKDALRVVSAGFSGTPESELAVESAHALAHALGAQLRAIAVLETGHLPGPMAAHKVDERRDHLEHELSEVLGRLPAGPDVVREVLEGAPLDKLEEAAEQSDVMVIGSRAYGPMHHALLGTVSGKLIRTAACPLLVVPRGAPSPVEELRAEATRAGA